MWVWTILTLVVAINKISICLSVIYYILYNLSALEEFSRFVSSTFFRVTLCPLCFLNSRRTLLLSFVNAVDKILDLNGRGKLRNTSLRPMSLCQCRTPFSSLPARNKGIRNCLQSTFQIQSVKELYGSDSLGTVECITRTSRVFSFFFFCFCLNHTSHQLQSHTHLMDRLNKPTGLYHPLRKLLSNRDIVLLLFNVWRRLYDLIISQFDS